MTRSPAVQKESSSLLKEDYGLVPKYLLQFKLNRAASAATKQVDIHTELHGALSFTADDSPSELLTVRFLHRQQLM